MTESDIKNENAQTASFARQPIFDKDRRLWGYELFYLGSKGSTLADLLEGHNLAAILASGVNIGLQQVFSSGTKVLVPFNEKDLIDKLPYVFPAGLTAVMVPENISDKPSVFQVLRQMKDDGYLIAASRFTGSQAYRTFYRLADIIVIDVYNRTTPSITDALEKTSSYAALTMAHRVEDPSRYEECKHLGYDLFHGAFFKSSDKIITRKLSSLEVSRFNLLKIIEQEQPDFTELAKIIQTDVTISYRLLTHLNSVAFGFPRKIQSVHQAILLLGWQKMKNWLRVVLLSDISKRKDASELILLSAQRGRFLEEVARDHDYWGFDPDGLNMLGMFSLLDALMGMPMGEIVAYLPLETKLKNALCREKNNEYLPLLNLIQCAEETRWAEAEEWIRRLNLSSQKVKTAFLLAVDWAAELDAIHST